MAAACFADLLKEFSVKLTQADQKAKVRPISTVPAGRDRPAGPEMSSSHESLSLAIPAKSQHSVMPFSRMKQMTNLGTLYSLISFRRGVVNVASHVATSVQKIERIGELLQV